MAVIAEAGVDRVISGESAAAQGIGAAVLHQCERASANGLLDRERIVRFEPVGDGCEDVGMAIPVRPRTAGCESCMGAGHEWVHLCLCLICGHVGCCDTSPHKHASAHYATTGHALMASAESGEQWAYCYVDELQMRTHEPVRPSRTAEPSLPSSA